MEEEVNSGSMTVERVDDSLSAALGTKEHTGRVRGVSVYCGWTDVYDGPKPKRRPRAKVSTEEMESRLAQVRQEVCEEFRTEYDGRMAEFESRWINQITSLTQQSEQQPPVSPGFRRSSQASGTEVLGVLDNLQVITTCS